MFFCISAGQAHRIIQGVMRMMNHLDAWMLILPSWLRKEADRLGVDSLQELRLRLNGPAQFCYQNKQVHSQKTVTREDVDFVVQTASRYSPWASSTLSDGYITAQGGHRIGLCGEAVVRNGVMTGMRNISSVCIRFARQIPGIAKKAAEYEGSVLIIGRPGSGKTTLLRDLIRLRSNEGKGSVAVVDERYELFPSINGVSCFDPGAHTDILYGCPKVQGIEQVLRTMGPSCIAMDEITAKEDCEALINAAWNGVSLLATVHATGIRDLQNRRIYRELADSRIFDTALIMKPDQSWYAERMDLCI